jgi:hypothetical protein
VTQGEEAKKGAQSGCSGARVFGDGDERSGFITTGIFEITVFWDFTPCSLVDSFGGPCCLLQGSKPSVKQKMIRS